MSNPELLAAIVALTDSTNRPAIIKALIEQEIKELEESFPEIDEEVESTYFEIVGNLRSAIPLVDWM